MSEVDYVATIPIAGKYVAGAKRGKTYNRRQPREKYGDERGSHSTVAKRAETRVNQLSFSFGFLLCMGFAQQDRRNFARSLEGLVNIGMKRCFAP